MGSLTQTMYEIMAAEEAEKALERQAIEATFPLPDPHILTLSEDELPHDEQMNSVVVDVPDSLKQKR